MKHRGDIDGLRALAVLPVLFFHAGLPFFTGGYVGVDIFFVISGYLITSIIAGEIGERRFSILRFYDRRARRILPALTAMVAATIAVGAFVLAPDDFAALGESVVSTALFFSNILFWRQSGYFDTETELKPLLHTWSLSVEEQFYVLFPIILIAAARLKLDLRLVVWGGLLASLGVSVLAVRSDQMSAFYLLHARAWELLAGSAIAVGAVPRLSSPRYREAAAALGVALIGVAVFAFDRATLFPGESAILPCLGAALVIMAGRDGAPTLTARLLAAQPLAFAGLISYSLYLWHWPIIVFLRYRGDGHLAPAEALLAVIASVMAAWLSWRFVERPFRRPGALKARTVLGLAAAATAAMAGIGLVGMAAGGDRGMERVYGPEIAALQRDARPIEARADCVNIGRAALLARGCAIGAKGVKPTIALIGDSFAGSLLPAIDAAFAGRGLSVLPYIWYSCPSILGTSRSEAAAWAPGFVRDCRAYVEATIAEIVADPAIRTVIVSNNYDWYLNRVSTINAAPILTADGAAAATGEANAEAIRARILATVERLAAAGKAVIFVGASPTGHIEEGARARLRARMKTNLPADAAIAMADCRDATRQVGDRAETALGRRFAYIDTRRFFVTERAGGEACLMVAGGVPMTTDGSHPTAAVAARIAAEIAAAILASLPAGPASEAAAPSGIRE